MKQSPQWQAKKLNAHQRQVLIGLASSETVKTLAFNLGVSAKTIEYHRATLYFALQIFDIAGITRFAIRAGLVKP